ncbi:efflux transporter periplasmic adaptor subunit [Aquitalea sp. FJL05]|uniref:efflux RND transporter periplasmic adaptor subunit n=2 Tax=Aquitalea TaxID=407217 RepID=UPI000F5A26E8|nr:HlyD family secretion protein [Aquitalea sp. FJL05]RQO77660.1 efflux transporter periplasmic adaptor subunit [Aquitalea sp. FJL05]
MKKLIGKAGPVVLTLIVVVAAVLVGRYLWDYYTNAPWTRDGHIRADVVQIAPDVSGLITEVKVTDNQLVKRGQVLFVIDRARYALALKQAEAALAQQSAGLSQAKREAARNRGLSDLVARENIEQSEARVQQDEASVAAATTAVEVARLNLQRTVVSSPVDGYLNDRTPRVGDYVSTGKPVLSMVDAHSFHVDGYFEETKMNRVQVNQPVEIQIMGEAHKLRGHVQSIAAGIEDRDRSNGATLLPNVNPTFNWVRLAQRIPVRITLDEVPADFRMIAGRTATVAVVAVKGGQP